MAFGALRATSRIAGSSQAVNAVEVSPEASAGGRLFGLSAHGKRLAWCRTVGAWLGGVVGGRALAPSPEPPLLFLPGLALCFGGG